MAKYALLKDGAFINVVNADENWTPPDGCIKTLFDPAIHVKPTPPEPAELYVTRYRFLFRLHSVMQRITLDVIQTAAANLTPTQIADMTPGATDVNGFGLDALRIIRIARQQMEALGDRVDLLSTDIDIFFAAASALGLYGTTSPEITAEIYRIKSNTLPE